MKSFKKLIVENLQSLVYNYLTIIDIKSDCIYCLLFSGSKIL